MNERVVVISDLHLASPKYLDAFRAGDALAAFVREYANANTTLVLAGDVFDLLPLPDRPVELSSANAPTLLQTAIDGVAAEPWGGTFFQNIRALLQAGGRCVILPGNHDPELHHPDARDILLRVLDLPDAPGLELHQYALPWQTQLGTLNVVVGHGHRGDKWNDIDPLELKDVFARGSTLSLPLPAGSRLVTDVLQPLKREKSGNPRFSFLDLLKPDKSAVLAALYLDPVRSLRLLPRSLGLQAEAWLNAFCKWIVDSPTLASLSAPENESNLAEDLVRLVIDEIDPNQRREPATAIQAFRSFLHGRENNIAPDTLASHGGVHRWFGRAWLREMSKDKSFFTENALSSDDRRVVDEHLPVDCGPRVVICGHTHAARKHDAGNERFYINTGTWIDLMDLPGINDDLQPWLNDLEADRAARFHKLTFAEVTSAGPALRIWNS